MVETSEKLDVARSLRAALKFGHIHEQSDIALAGACLRHLLGQVRITVTGPGCGDAIALSNLLAGRPLLPNAASGRLVEIKEGQATMATAHLGNGETKSYTNYSKEDGFEKSVRLMQITTDAPMLVSAATTCATAKSTNRLRRLTGLVKDSTDIVLWLPCDLGDEELEIWCSLPDHIRAHGYLVLTPTCKDPTLLCKRARGHFADIIVVDPVSALEACHNIAGVDTALLQDSGGIDLLTFIEGEIRYLDQSVIDESEHLLMHAAVVASDESGQHSPETCANRPMSRPTTLVGRMVDKQQPAPTNELGRFNSEGAKKNATPWSLGL